MERVILGAHIWPDAILSCLMSLIIMLLVIEDGGGYWGGGVCQFNFVVMLSDKVRVRGFASCSYRHSSICRYHFLGTRACHFIASVNSLILQQ